MRCGEEEWEGAAVEKQKHYVHQGVRDPRQAGRKGACSLKLEREPCSSKTHPKTHCDHLPNGERIACAEFKEAVSKMV